MVIDSLQKALLPIGEKRFSSSFRLKCPLLTSMAKEVFTLFWYLNTFGHRQIASPGSKIGIC